jgi:hypothetical protein
VKIIVVGRLELGERMPHLSSLVEYVARPALLAA